MSSAMERRQASLSVSPGGSGTADPSFPIGAATTATRHAELERQAQTIDAQAAAPVERAQEIKHLNENLKSLQGAYDKLWQERAAWSATSSARDSEYAQSGARDGPGETAAGACVETEGKEAVRKAAGGECGQEDVALPHRRRTAFAAAEDGAAKILSTSPSRGGSVLTPDLGGNETSFKSAAEDEGSSEKEGHPERGAAAGGVLVFRSPADVVVIPGAREQHVGPEMTM